MKNTTRIALLVSFLLTVALGFAAVQPVLAQGGTPPDIDGDQVVIGNAFRLSENQRLNGDLAIMGGTATLEVNSIVNGNVAVLGGSLQVDGKVNGDIVAVGGHCRLIHFNVTVSRLFEEIGSPAVFTG